MRRLCIGHVGGGALRRWIQSSRREGPMREEACMVVPGGLCVNFLVRVTHLLSLHLSLNPFNLNDIHIGVI